MSRLHNKFKRAVAERRGRKPVGWWLRDRQEINHGGTEFAEKSRLRRPMLLLEKLTQEIIGAAIEVHRELGPGLLESAYEACFCYELRSRGISVECQVPLPVLFKGVRLDCGYRIDACVDDSVIVELKSVEELTDLHRAQLLTYLRLSGKKVGLLLNFNVPVLKDGIVRMVL